MSKMCLQQKLLTLVSITGRHSRLFIPPSLYREMGPPGLSLRREGDRGASGEIKLPAELKGTFIWEDFSMELKEVRNEVDVKKTPINF